MHMTEIQSKPPKREAELNHQRQLIWQILVPLFGALVVALVFLVIDISAAESGDPAHSNWAMIATVLLVLLWLILGLIPLAVVILSIWLLRNAHKSISSPLVTINAILLGVKSRIDGIADTVSTPAIMVRSANAGFRQLIAMILHPNPSTKE